MLANLRHGGDAVVIASAISRSAQQVSARPGLTTREELRGKRWGVNARNDADECAIVMAFERWGWDSTKDAEIVVVGTDGPRLDLLLDAARVDVAIMLPQAVDTPMYRGAGTTAAAVDGIMKPDEVAQIVLQAMQEERFLILSHPVVQEYMQRKAGNIDRWLAGMRRLRDKTGEGQRPRG